LENIPGSDNNVFEAEYFDAVAPDQLSISQTGGPLNHVSGAEYWVVTHPAGISTPNVRLYWEDGTRSDIQTLAGNDLVVSWYNGTDWESKGQGGTTGTIGVGSVISATTFSAFSPITLGSAFNNNALPIELISFVAEAVGRTVALTWETASENNNDYFTLLRSKDGESFEEVTILPGAGNSLSATEYRFIDERPYQGLSYYKLLQTDFNGTETEVGLVLVQMDDSPGRLAISSHPNPFSNESVVINLSGLNAGEIVPVIVLDEFGRSYYFSKHKADDSGYIDFIIEETNSWSSGIFIIQVSTEKGTISTKLIKL
jgi:hypothetical protein